MIEIKIPTVGESISEVTISEWTKQNGDQVEMDEVIAELESDKATFELTAEQAGTLQILAEAGETVEVGAVVCKIETNGQDSEKDDQPSDDTASKTAEEKPKEEASKKEKEAPQPEKKEKKASRNHTQAKSLR